MLFFYLNKTGTSFALPLRHAQIFAKTRQFRTRRKKPIQKHHHLNLKGRDVVHLTRLVVLAENAIDTSHELPQENLEWGKAQRERKATNRQIRL